MKINVDILRQFCELLLQKEIVESDFNKDYKIGVNIRKGKDETRLDCSTMKKYGVLKVPWTIDSRTGLVCIPLKPSEILNFRPSMATIKNALKRANIKRKITKEDIQKSLEKKIKFYKKGGKYFMWYITSNKNKEFKWYKNSDKLEVFGKVIVNINPLEEIFFIGNKKENKGFLEWYKENDIFLKSSIKPFNEVKESFEKIASLNLSERIKFLKNFFGL